MAYGYSYTFPALRGIQAGQEYFVAMCPLHLLPKLFLFDESVLPPELRAQRSINIARIPAISRYVLENRDNYAFSAITASIDGEVAFEPADIDGGIVDAGKIVIPMSARFIINDGQHRRAAIEAALEEDPSLGEETIAVVFYIDAGLRRSQQLFADLNQHAVRSTKSIGILYDYRAALSSLSRELVKQVPCFTNLTELEKTTISNRSTKLFTLSGIHIATGALLGKKDGDPVDAQEHDNAVRFWCEMCKIIPEWQLAAKRQINASELHRDYVHSHSVVLHAVGLAGHDLLRKHPTDWTSRLSALQSVDWARSNTIVWEGRAMSNGRMSKSWKSLQMTAAFLKLTLGLCSATEEKLAADQCKSQRGNKKSAT